MTCPSSQPGTSNARLPERIEKHGQWWWIMGLEKFQVDGVDHYAYGGYTSKKDAEQAWVSLARSVKRWDPDWCKVIHEVPADYRPEQYETVPDRKGHKKRRPVVENDKPPLLHPVDSGTAIAVDAEPATAGGLRTLPVETDEWGTNWVDNVTELCTCVAE